MATSLDILIFLSLPGVDIKKLILGEKKNSIQDFRCTVEIPELMVVDLDHYLHTINIVILIEIIRNFFFFFYI